MRITATALALLLAFVLPARTRAESALNGLLEARSASSAAALFDGSRLLPALPVAVPAQAPAERDARFSPPPALERAKPAPDSAAALPVPPRPAENVSDGFIGLYPESGFELGTGRCAACNGPLEGKWYFPDELIATPKTGPPAIVWMGSSELIRGARLSEDGRAVTLPDGSRLALALVPKISSNRSYFDDSSLKHLQGRPLRIRGELVESNGVKTLIARTLWPEDYRLDPATMKTADAATLEGIDALVAADNGGAREEFSTTLLWERPGTERSWTGKPVMGLMLNGAQGDDDESLGGHFSFFTGRVGPDGSMADWMFDNFYSMDTVSEKGILASMVPMDKYMTDLNAGQSWYRPTYMLAAVMKDDRVPAALQEAFRDRYAKYYAHQIEYDLTFNPCTAQIVDPLRENGWNYPEQGKTPSLIAHAVAAAATLTSDDPNAKKELYDVLRQEPTHLYPRAAFNSLGADLLALAGAPNAQAPDREYTPLEKSIAEDIEAVVFVRLPQIPSSRRFGRDPAGGFFDYFSRVPLDRSKWETLPTVPRPYPPTR